MSVKSDTNKKWTSSDKYRDNFDNIFKKEEILPDQDCWEDVIIDGYGIYDSTAEFAEWNLKHKERLKCNLEIIEILKDVATRNPELRFGQMLINLQVVEDNVDFDFFYEESDKTLDKLKDEYYKFLQADKGVF